MESMNSPSEVTITSASTQTGTVGVTSTSGYLAPAKKPLSLVQDPAGDFSSKRFESLMAFGIGVLVVIGTFIAGALGVDLSKVPVTQMLVALLGYSAALQGISWGSETNLFPGGSNTSSPLSGLVSRIIGGSTTTSETGQGK